MVNRRKGFIKAEKPAVKKDIQYFDIKREDSIKYCRVECYKKLGREFVLDKTIFMVLRHSSLDKLKYGLLKVYSLIEWDMYGKIT